MPIPRANLSTVRRRMSTNFSFRFDPTRSGLPLNDHDVRTIAMTLIGRMVSILLAPPSATGRLRTDS